MAGWYTVRSAPPRQNAKARLAAPEFETWLRDAPEGNVIVYFTGDLARTRFNKRIPLPACAAAMAAADDGLVLLVQRRIGDGEFEYLAARTGKPYRTPDLPARMASPSEAARLRGEAVFAGAGAALEPVDLP